MIRQERGICCSRRWGSTSPIVIVLLSGILITLVVLIALLATQKGKVSPPPASPVPALSDGQKATRPELQAPPKSPRPIGDPDRIREILQEGKTYSAVLKAGLDARVEDKAWGIKEVVSLAYAVEMAIDRTIERNDGKRIVESRTFVASRNVKLLCKVESLTISLGVQGTLLLGALDYLSPGTSAELLVVKPVAEAILSYGADEAARSQAAKAVVHVDSLSGKRVRITYVDGVGVESIEPVGCTVSAQERDFVFNTAVLSDYYILPDVRLKPGASWAVDGSQMAGFIDPSLRGATSGEVTIVRGEDSQEGGKQYAILQIQKGSLNIDSSDASNRRLAGFTPRGTLRFCITDGFVDRANITGRINIEEVSTDHILFETSFRSRPALKIEYSCSIR